MRTIATGTIARSAGHDAWRWMSADNWRSNAVGEETERVGEQGEDLGMIKLRGDITGVYTVRGVKLLAGLEMEPPYEPSCSVRSHSRSDADRGVRGWTSITLPTEEPREGGAKGNTPSPCTSRSERVDPYRWTTPRGGGGSRFATASRRTAVSISCRLFCSEAAAVTWRCAARGDKDGDGPRDASDRALPRDASEPGLTSTTASRVSGTGASWSGRSSRGRSPRRGAAARRGRALGLARNASWTTRTFRRGPRTMCEGTVAFASRTFGRFGDLVASVRLDGRAKSNGRGPRTL